MRIVHAVTVAVEPCPVVEQFGIVGILLHPVGYHSRSLAQIAESQMASGKPRIIFGS